MAVLSIYETLKSLFGLPENEITQIVLSVGIVLIGGMIIALLFKMIFKLIQIFEGWR